MNRPHPQRPIVAFGDSLVEGIGASTANDWVSLLSDRYAFPIMNKGKKQDTTRSAQARLDHDVLQHDPFLVILLLGGNDIIVRIPKKETFLNLGNMIDRIQQHGQAYYSSEFGEELWWMPSKDSFKTWRR